MSHFLCERTLRAERRAAITQRAMAFGRHRQSAGTVCVRPQFAKPARARHETRRALVASKPAQAGSEPRHSLPPGDRATYPLDEGSS